MNFDAAETAEATTVISDGNGEQYGPPAGEGSPSSLPMSLPEYKRYGRQMILGQVGLAGQLKLRAARVIVIGAGGLGCPAVQYLAAAGIGHITIVDHDSVETSNLARQILHTDGRVGMNKARSAAIAAQIINPHIHLEAVSEALSARNAVPLISRHDLVLDCTDNVLTRYLISDAAVLCGVQVVSGAAQGLDGQLVVLHKDLTLHTGVASMDVSSYEKHKGATAATARPRGPCYRCLYPKAPRPEDVTDCEDGGVLGGVTGLVGTMQALEAVKLLAGLGNEDEPVSMTLISPLSYPPFRTVKLRPQRTATCRSCGLDKDMVDDDVRRAKIQADLVDEDYVAFCGLDRRAKGSGGFSSVDVERFARESLREQGQRHIVDVRPPVEYNIARLPGTINLPFREIDADPALRYKDLLELMHSTTAAKAAKDDEPKTAPRPVYVLCRRGNDSRLACEALNAAAAAAAVGQRTESAADALEFVNVFGGLRAWAEKVDRSFPIY